MAAITDGFKTRRVTLEANTLQVVFFPGNAQEVSISKAGDGTVACAPNREVLVATDTGAIALGAVIKGVTFYANRDGAISMVSFYGAAEEVQWVAR